MKSVNKINKITSFVLSFSILSSALSPSMAQADFFDDLRGMVSGFVGLFSQNNQGQGNQDQVRDQEIPRENSSKVQPSEASQINQASGSSLQNSGNAGVAAQQPNIAADQDQDSALNKFSGFMEKVSPFISILGFIQSIGSLFGSGRSNGGSSIFGSLFSGIFSTVGVGLAGLFMWNKVIKKKANKLVDKVGKKIEKANETITNMNSVMTNARGLMHDLNETVEKSAPAITNLVEKTKEVAKEVNNIVGSVNKTVEATGELLTKNGAVIKDFAKEANEGLKTVKETVSEVKGAVVEARETMKTFNETVEKSGPAVTVFIKETKDAIAEVNKTVGTVKQTVEAVGKTLKEQGSEINGFVKEVNTGLENVNKTVANVKGTVKAFGEVMTKNGSEITVLAKEANKALESVNSTVSKVNEVITNLDGALDKNLPKVQEFVDKNIENFSKLADKKIEKLNEVIASAPAKFAKGAGSSLFNGFKSMIGLGGDKKEEVKLESEVKEIEKKEEKTEVEKKKTVPVELIKEKLVAEKKEIEVSAIVHENVVHEKKEEKSEAKPGMLSKLGTSAVNGVSIVGAKLLGGLKTFGSLIGLGSTKETVVKRESLAVKVVAENKVQEKPLVQEEFNVVAGKSEKTLEELLEKDETSSFSGEFNLPVKEEITEKKLEVSPVVKNKQEEIVENKPVLGQKVMKEVVEFVTGNIEKKPKNKLFVDEENPSFDGKIEAEQFDFAERELIEEQNNKQFVFESPIGGQEIEVKEAKFSRFVLENELMLEKSTSVQLEKNIETSLLKESTNIIEEVVKAKDDFEKNNRDFAKLSEIIKVEEVVKKEEPKTKGFLGKVGGFFSGWFGGSKKEEVKQEVKQEVKPKVELEQNETNSEIELNLAMEKDEKLQQDLELAKESLAKKKEDLIVGKDDKLEKIIEDIVEDNYSSDARSIVSEHQDDRKVDFLDALDEQDQDADRVSVNSDSYESDGDDEFKEAE